jgi:hypothetical protein
MNIKQKVAALGVGVALVGGGGAIATAAGGPSSATTGAQTAQAAPPGGGQPGHPGQANGRPAGALMRRVVHGDLTMQAKDGFQKVQYDRGTVTAKDSGGFTIKRPDNVSVTVKVADTTKYKGIQGLDQLQVNQPVIVLSKDGTAVMVGQRSSG